MSGLLAALLGLKDYLPPGPAEQPLRAVLADLDEDAQGILVNVLTDGVSS